MSTFKVTNPSLLTATAISAVKIPLLEIWRDARFTCPVDTGNLANSIIPNGPYSAGMGIAAGTVGTNVDYAPFVEFGTGSSRAQPYLGPALERARARYSR